jgi:hypothetical protein
VPRCLRRSRRLVIALVSVGVLALVFTSLTACGGLTDETLPGSAEADSSDPSLDDGAASPATDAGNGGFICVLQPVEGVPCTSRDSLCAPPADGCGSPGDPAPVWQCIDRQWQLLPPAGCDGGPPFDAGDFGDAQPPGCGDCTGQVCVVTRAEGVMTYHCEPKPVACTGDGPSCSCAGSLCGEGCACLGRSSSGVLECSCASP